MMDKKGFDLWADGYDKAVGLSDEQNTYPFAGYKQVLQMIYQDVMESGAKDILDIGIGTGTLSHMLYKQGCHICGQDFSEKMIALAKEKMPDAELYQGDFSKGPVAELQQKTYDAMIATYSLHHLDTKQKKALIAQLLPLLRPNGKIYIGDVAFLNRQEEDACALGCEDEWDKSEHYLIVKEMEKLFPDQCTFDRASYCAGVITITK